MKNQVLPMLMLGQVALGANYNPCQEMKSELQRSGLQVERVIARCDEVKDPFYHILENKLRLGSGEIERRDEIQKVDICLAKASGAWVIYGKASGKAKNHKANTSDFLNTAVERSYPSSRLSVRFVDSLLVANITEAGNDKLDQVVKTWENGKVIRTQVTTSFYKTRLRPGVRLGYTAREKLDFEFDKASQVLTATHFDNYQNGFDWTNYSFQLQCHQ